MRGIAIAIAAFLLWLPGQERYTSGVEGVRVDVLVTDGRQPVGGLTVANFELRDSGVIQQIASVTIEEVPLSVMLALDTSASVAGQPLADLKDAALAAVRLLQPGDRAALMTFSGAVQLRTPWTGQRADLERGIAATEASGSTTLHDAAYAAVTLRDPRSGGRPLVLLFSDGMDTQSWLPGKNVIDIARRNDAVVYVATLGRETLQLGRTPRGPSSVAMLRAYRLDFRSGIQEAIENAPVATLLEPFVDALAGETGGKVLNAERSGKLRDTFVAVMKEFRSRYLLTYTPRGVNAGGWHALEVRLKNARGKVTARKGYLR